MSASPNVNACILIVDDEERNVRVLERVLATAGYCRVRAFTDPRGAVSQFSELQPDLLVLDLHMPEMDGIAVTERIRAELPAAEYFPILILTGDPSPQACRRALAMGATDFVAKPFDVHEVLLRISNLLETRRLHRQVAQHNEELERNVRERTAELETAHLDTVARLARAAEFRDDETGRHTERVGQLSEILALEIGWTGAEATLLRCAAPLHDIGKIGIPDAILRKPGPLTLRQQRIMRTHASIGAQILSGGRSKFMRIAEGIAHSHHERWDGNGYPQQLAGEAIPMAARIVAVADFFDAMVHDRVYRKAWAVGKVFAEIAKESGRAFDPMVAAVCERPLTRAAMLAANGREPVMEFRRRWTRARHGLGEGSRRLGSAAPDPGA